ncbi:MAG: isoprenylcysteine carboxylmethyltransferase family protein [Pseudomonadota bacterium]
MENISLLTIAFLVFLISQRLVELDIAKRNTENLIKQGAVEHGADHYPYMVVMHALWVVSIIVLGYENALNLGWLAVYALLQIFRIWILATLGPRWTTRIIVLDKPLVKAGPFRFFEHPNYILVVAEIFVTPMVLGLWPVAIVFTLLNAAMLYVRISAENKALAHLREST